MYGILTSVEQRPLGSSLDSAAGVGETTLFVDFVADFNEDGGQLLVNGTTLDYVTVDPDLQTITLTVPLAVAALVDDQIQVVDAGTVAVEWVANVAIDDGDTVAALIPTSLIAYFTDGPAEEPVTVQIELVGEDYEVTKQPNAEPVLDGATVWNPRVRRGMNLVTIADDGNWHQVTSWTDSEVDGLEVDDGAHVTYAGTYAIQATCNWITNATGRRGVRLVINGVALAAGTFVAAADSGGRTYVTGADVPRLAELDEVTVELFQTSGAGLAIGGGTFTMYRVSS